MHTDTVTHSHLEILDDAPRHIEESHTFLGLAEVPVTAQHSTAESQQSQQASECGFCTSFGRLLQEISPSLLSFLARVLAWVVLEQARHVTHSDRGRARRPLRSASSLIAAGSRDLSFSAASSGTTSVPPGPVAAAAAAADGAANDGADDDDGAGKGLVLCGPLPLPLPPLPTLGSSRDDCRCVCGPSPSWEASS